MTEYFGKNWCESMAVVFKMVILLVNFQKWKVSNSKLVLAYAKYDHFNVLCNDIIKEYIAFPKMLSMLGTWFYWMWSTHMRHTAVGETNTPKKEHDVIKWKHFPRYWPFVRGMHQSPMVSPHKGQWGGALMFSLINKQLSNQSRRPLFATPLRSLWRHCNVAARD